MNNPSSMTQLVVIGILGKLLTGPWMREIYTAKEESIHHLDVVDLVKVVLGNLKAAQDAPEAVRQRSEDFFGKPLASDDVLKSLQEFPVLPVFDTWLKSAVSAIQDVLLRQFKAYLVMDVTPELRNQTQSAAPHNMDSERVMGMISAAQKRAPAATMCFMSCKIRAQVNDTITYLEHMEQSQKNSLLSKAIPFGRLQRSQRKAHQRDVQADITQRIQERRQAQAENANKNLEKEINACPPSALEALVKKYGSSDDVDDVLDLLNGLCVGRKFLHIWYEKGEHVQYCGEVLQYTKGRTVKGKKGPNKYLLAFWKQIESPDEALDYSMPASALAADLIRRDFEFIN
jgi:hypothetical protein